MRFMLHSAVTIMDTAPRGLLGADGRPMPTDSELCQFAAEFKRSPIPVHAFEQAFSDMKAACMQKARDAGLITEDRHARY